MNNKEIEEIEKLESKLMMLGLNGMAYTSLWDETAKKLSKLKQEVEE